MLYVVAQILTALTLFAPTIIRQDMFFPFITGKVIFLRVIIELALASFLAHIFLSPNKQQQWHEIKRRLKHPVVITLSVFTALFIFTAFTGVNVTQSFWSNFERGEGAFQILHYYLFFLLAYLLFAEPKALRRLIVVQIIASTYITLYALAQSLLLQKKLGLIGDGFRPSGTFGNPSYISAYLLINFAFLIYFLLRAKSWKRRTFISALLALQFYIFMQAGTRGAFLALVIVGMITFVINIFTVQSNKVRAWLTGILTVGLVSLVFMIITHAAPFWKDVPVINRFLNFETAKIELQPRFWTWGSAVAGVIEKPLFGWGAENFPYAFDKYYNPNHYGYESFFDRTHNVFLEYLITGGFPLFLAFCAIFFFYYKTLRIAKKDFWYSVLVVIPIAYLIQGFFLFDVLGIYVALYLFLAFSLNLQHPAESDSPFRDFDYEKRGASLLVALGITTLTVVSISITDLQPINKNLAITKALQTSGGVPAFQEFQKALLVPSAVGQEEAIGNLNRFLVGAIEQTVAAGGSVPTNVLRTLLDETNQWYDENKAIMPGVKDAYLNGGLNIRTGISFRQPDYLARGKKIYNDIIAYAPTRIEVLLVQLDVARYEKDTKTYEAVLKQLKTFRPDIDWSKR